MCDHETPQYKKPQDETNTDRRDFIRNTALVGSGLLISGAAPAFAASDKGSKMNTPSKGYAAVDTSGTLVPWTFERRPVGDDDVLIDIKFASICHSDIHQMKGHWGPQVYPQVPGHEIVGVVAAVGKNVTKFKVGDRAGVGCMVDGCTDKDGCEHGGEQYHPDTTFTYGNPYKKSPTGISQGGYSTNIVVRDHYAVHIPETISFEEAMQLFSLPRTIGEYEGQELSVNVGRFGPYIKLGEQFISIPRGEDLYEMDLERAIALIKEKEEADMGLIL